MVDIEHVEGEDRGDIMLYAISTCVWCKKTKKLLNDLGVKYDYIFVDKLGPEEKKKVEKEVEKWNPRCSFPTIVIDNDRCIVGYRDREIKEALEA